MGIRKPVVSSGLVETLCIVAYRPLLYEGNRYYYITCQARGETGSCSFELHDFSLRSRTRKRGVKRCSLFVTKENRNEEKRYYVAETNTREDNV
jgi:hypothetical protein